MPDVVTPEVRSRMMAGIRGKNTKPEMFLRSRIHAAGLRFRIHDRSLPGNPDMVFKGKNAVLFFHGCFWHGHDCTLFKWPGTRPEFWRLKIERNRQNDIRAMKALNEAGWRHGVVWECALRGPGRLNDGLVISKCISWLNSKRKTFELRGKT
jgi:DNA mismatch endonuclease (patch repair protein)